MGRAGLQRSACRQLVGRVTSGRRGAWPRLRSALPGRSEDLALLDEMKAEHSVLDPLLESVERILDGQPGDLAGCVRELTATLCKHLDHEETSALPLIQSVLTPADWRGFAGQMRRRQGVKGAAVYIPWVLDGQPPAKQRRFLAALPAPARLISRALWEPRYRKRQLWGL